MSEEDETTNVTWALEAVLREVLIHLSTPDLLNCSLVSKKWHFESRSILQNHRKCIAYIGGSTPCIDILNLNNNLARIPLVQFNGLKINLQHLEHSPKKSCVGLGNLERNFSFLLNRFQLKYLEIVSLDRHRECPLDEICGRLISRRCETIEELEFGCVPWMYRVETTPKFWLPRLKILYLSPDLCEPFALHFFTNVEEIAPNLKEIRGGLNIEDLKVFPTDKYHLVKELVIHRYPSNWPADNGQGDELEIDVRSLSTMTLEDLNVNINIHHDSPKSWEMIGLILKSSSESLKVFRIGACSLLNLVRTGLIVEPMINVSSLHLGLLPYWFDNAAQVQMRTISKNLNFSQVFPSMRTLNLVDDHPHGFYTDCYCCMNDGGDNDDTQELRHLNVESLIDCYYLLSPLTFGSVGKMFPNVQNFESVNAYPDPVNSYDKFWSCCWKNLKNVSLTFECGIGDNFDAIFCGVQEEEARFLQRCTEDFLTKVNIVSTRSSVTCLENLEKLSMRVIIQEEGAHGDPNLFFLTKVTGILAFGQMNGVHIEVNCIKNFGALTHLVPFANVKYLA